MITKNFSGALQLTDLDDFIGPSQQCIIPMQSKLADNADDGLIKLHTKASHKAAEGSTPKIAKITLNDCLACSGCITSAESILIDQQDYREAQRSLLRNQALDRNDPNRKLTVVSISPQSLSSLAVKYKLDGLTCARRITAFLKAKLGIDHVYDISYARNFTLIEMKNEFIQRFRHNRQNLPLLTSECPGWICYAEKTQGDYIIRFISRVKSPQQILGWFIKRDPQQSIYHLSIEPCFDKKLEASRKDFFSEQRQQYDVDCVISTGEFDKWLDEEQFDPQLNAELDYDEPYSMRDPNGQMILTHRGSGSGGYLDYVFRSAAKELFNIDMADEPLEFKVTKNPDLREVTLTVDGQPRLRFAYAYGFRNVQNIVQKLKRNRCDYDFVEIMACPSGCINGGGQIRSVDVTLDDVRHTYESLPHLKQPLDLSCHDENRASLFTEYRAIEKNTFIIKRRKMALDIAVMAELPPYDDDEEIQLMDTDGTNLQVDEALLNTTTDVSSVEKHEEMTSVLREEETEPPSSLRVIEKIKVYIRDGPNAHHVETISIDRTNYDLPTAEKLASVQLTEDMQKDVWQSLNLTSEDFRTLSSPGGISRPESLYVRGVNNMSTQDILNYFEEFKPVGIEWICDQSCNVFWRDGLTPIRILATMTKPGPCIPHRRPTSFDHVMRLSKRKASSLSTSKNETADTVDIALPPGHWREGNFQQADKPESSVKLYLRYTTLEDRKVRGAENHSEYYRQYGNPNYNNMTGLISRSKKRELNFAKVNRFRDFTVVKSNDAKSIQSSVTDETATAATSDDLTTDSKVKFTVVLPPKKNPQNEEDVDDDGRDYRSKRQRRRSWDDDHDRLHQERPHFTVTIDSSSKAKKYSNSKTNKPPKSDKNYDDDDDHDEPEPVTDARQILERKRRNRR